MTKESNANLVYDWVQDMTVPLRPITNDLVNRQYCSKPESYSDQLERMNRDGEVEIREFQLKYPNHYNAFLRNQYGALLDYIRNFEESK